MKLETLSVKRNPKNSFLVVYKDVGIKNRYVLHYSADPDKDPKTPQGAKWREEASRVDGIMSAKWQREMEGNALAYLGKALHPEFRHEGPDSHVRKIEPLEDYRLIRGWDPAWCCSACVWLQVVDTGKGTPQVRVYKELRTFDADIGKLAEKVIQITEKEFPKFDGRILDEIDVFGKTHHPSSKESPLAVLAQYGIRPGFKKTSPEDRILLVNRLLRAKTAAGEPCFVIDPECQGLITGFQGLYRRKENSDVIDDTEIVDLMDAMGYGIINNTTLRTEIEDRAAENPTGVNIMELLHGKSEAEEPTHMEI